MWGHPATEIHPQLSLWSETGAWKWGFPQFKGVAPGPLPHQNIERFSSDSGETLLMGQSKISQGRQASMVPIVGGPPFITQEQVSAFSTLPFALSCLSLSLLCWPLKVLACLGILVSSNNSAFESLCDSKMENRCLP